MSLKTYALVMAGGKGTRFWPESTRKNPKQYLKLTGSESLLSDTLDRFDGYIEKNERYIITVKEQETLAKENSSNKIGPSNIIFEPSGRNTAPCILLALASLLKSGAKQDDVVVIVPSDHVVLNKDGFQDTLKKATKYCFETKKIVTIGIRPSFPHTGFGYIQKGKELDVDYFKIGAFKEKPDFETAKEYIASGEYYWNAGMFVSRIDVLLGEFEKHASSMFSHLDSLIKAVGTVEISDAYNKLESDSIDYAIMEKSGETAVVPAEFDWNDLGSWDALEAVIKAEQGNTIVQTKDHYFGDSKGNIIFAPNQFVGLKDIQDMIIVSNDDVLMILPKSKSQEVKEILKNAPESLN